MKPAQAATRILDVEFLRLRVRAGKFELTFPPEAGIQEIMPAPEAQPGGGP